MAADRAAAPRPVAAAVAAVVAAVLVGLGGAACGAPAGGGAPAPALTAVPATPLAAAAAAPAPAAPDRADLRATEVTLPTLAVRSRLVDLDVGADGAMAVPADPALAGWFVGGSAPGEPGPTVIAGHVDSREGPAVFHRLGGLVPGDRIEVTRSDRRVFAYRVATVEQHPKDAFPTARVYGPTPGPVLHLITCGGAFDRRSRHYRDNVVVTAIPAP